MSDELGPLAMLARKLRAYGPPSLSIILARINQMEDFKEFVALIREFLPERECDILRERTPSDQMAIFAGYFEDRYFSLEPYYRDGESENYEDLTNHIPVIIRGISWEDYDGIASDARESIQLMTYMIESPYDESDNRVALAEACRQHVPEALLKQVPENGFSLDELQKLLKNTPHEGLLAWAEMVHQATGNPFLDTDYEMYGYSILPDWEPEEVRYLTEQWQQADLMDAKLNKTVTWLEVDLPARFEELLLFVLNKRKEVIDGKRRDDGLPVGVAGKP